MGLRQASHTTLGCKADLRMPQRAQNKRKRPALTASCAPSPSEKKTEGSLEDGEVEEPKAKKSRVYPTINTLSGRS